MLKTSTNLFPGNSLTEIPPVTPALPEENLQVIAAKQESDQEDYDYLFRQMYLFLKLID